MDLVDPKTGQGAPLGQLGQLGGWSPNLVLSADGTRLYGCGNSNGSFANKLATLDLTSGIWSEVTTAPTEMYVLAGVTDDQHVIGVFWTGSVEEVDLVDPATGIGTNVGQLGDLHTWDGQLVYDHAAHVVYAWGQNNANARFLYSLNIETHVSHAVAVPPSNVVFSFGGVAASGDVIGMTWTGAAEVVMKLDPTTGVSTPNGVLVGLQGVPQFGSMAYDANANVAYAIGAPDGSNAGTFYTVDLATNLSTSVVAAQQYALARP